MPLTPADVHNVAFKKPPIGKRGYDEEEVDAFLDEVERELARLIEENNDLRSQVERARSGQPAPAAGGGGNDVETRRLAQENADLKGQMERLRQEKAAAQQAAQQAQQAAAQAAQQAAQQQQPQRAAAAPVSAGDPGGEQQALRVLMLAQRTADEHVEEARREADKLLSDARAKADELTRDARSKAEALEREARQRHQEAMGGLDAKRSALQKHIEELKAFEREYRTRLKAYLESQLRDLDSRGQAMENEVTRDAQPAGLGGGIGGAFGGGMRGLGLGQADSGSAEPRGH
ncbi:MAG TPA: DivIVA domain-containing protein [Mycobacteriales bacterium]|jgi:DivIVA domain-containing protein|nr:DivIVA domain-containing protein [Mycobacteriales bacterium]